MRIRFELPEPGLSRAARACLAGSLLLIVGFFVVGGIWWPVSRIAEVTGSNPRIDPPVSVMAEWEHDPEDRWILSVARDGRLWHAGKPCEPADLGSFLQEAALAFEDGGAGCGERALWKSFRSGGRASKLILLLRADRAALWGTVHDVMRRAGEQGIYRIQIHARPPDAWESKVLGVQLPWRAEAQAAIDVHIRRAPDGTPAYAHADLVAPDAMSLRQRLRSRLEEDPDERAVGAIRAPRDVPFEAIVGALDAFAAAGFLRVDFFAEDETGREARAEVR